MRFAPNSLHGGHPVYLNLISDDNTFRTLLSPRVNGSPAAVILLIVCACVY